MRKRTVTVILDQNPISRQEVLAVSIDGAEPGMEECEKELILIQALDVMARARAAQTKKEVGPSRIQIAGRLN